MEYITLSNYIILSTVVGLFLTTSFLGKFNKFLRHEAMILLIKEKGTGLCLEQEEATMLNPVPWLTAVSILFVSFALLWPALLLPNEIHRLDDWFRREDIAYLKIINRIKAIQESDAFAEHAES